MKSRQDYGTRLAQAAGSLSALALLPAGAQAGIIYNNASLSIRATSRVDVGWDVDNNGTNEFALWMWGTGWREAAGLRAVSNARGMVQKQGDRAFDIRNLSVGFVVGPTLKAGYQRGVSHTWLTVVEGRGVASSAKGFSANTPGYLGFSFTKDGTDLFYGWAKMTIGVPNNGFTIDGWAYNNIAGASIQVGEGASSVPEPATPSLLLIGLGAGGLRAWRRRKQALAADQPSDAIN